MAKPRNSKLLAVRQGQATGKGSPKNAKKISKDANEKRPVVAVPNIIQDSSIRFSDFIEEGGSTPTLGSNTASQTPGSSVSRSKSALSQTSIFSTRQRQSVGISRKIRRLNKDLGSTKIYKLRKQLIEGHAKIQPDPIEDAHNDAHNSSDDAHNTSDDAYNSPESKEVEEEQSASDDDLYDDSVFSATSFLSFVKLDSDSDQEMKERSRLLNDMRNIPEWDGLSATTTIAPSLAEEDSRMGVFREPLDATSYILQLEEASLQSEQDNDLLFLEENTTSSKKDSEAPITHTSSGSELASNDEADTYEVQRPQVEVDHIPDITQIAVVSSSLEKNYGDQQSKLLFSQTIQSYLYELVDTVVEHTERAQNQLRKRLDKHKLHKQLCAIVEDDCHEREKNDYLITRLTGHHLQRLRYSLITQDHSSSKNAMNHHRYQNALNVLDSLLKKEQEAERIYITERNRLQAELAEKESQDEQEINRLEVLIRETLLPHARMPERLESVIDTFLRQMSKKRNKISEIRLSLINKQHLNSYIMQKLEEKETIAEGLTLHTYETTMEEVNKLGRRLTFKTVELQRLYNMFSNKAHTISHLRCRRKLLSRTFRVAKDELCQLGKKLSDLRDKMHQGHMKHNRLLAQIQEVRHKGGLMNYPLLLMDFDKTDQLVRDKRERVSQLRAHHDSLLGKIEEVELAVQRTVSNGFQKALIL